MYDFGGLAVSTQPILPRSIHDEHDAIIVAHFIRDTLVRVFGNLQDRPSFVHSTQLKPDENPEGHEFAELFVTNNSLIEYSHPPKGLEKFVIRQDLISPPIWQGSDLREALIQLLTEDAKVSITDSWRIFTRG